MRVDREGPRGPERLQVDGEGPRGNSEGQQVDKKGGQNGCRLNREGPQVPGRLRVGQRRSPKITVKGDRLIAESF